MARGHPAEPGARRSRWRRLLRVAAVLGLALLVLVVGGLIVLHTPAVRQYALARLVQLLEARQIGLSASALEYNLFGPSVTIHDLSVRSLRTPDLPTFLRADRVHVAIGLPSLLRGLYHVRDGDIDGLDIHLVIDESGRNNLPRPPDRDDAEEPAGDPVRYLIDRFSIDMAAVRYEDRRRQLDVVVRIPELDVSGDELTGRHEIRMSADGEVRYQDRQLVLRTIEALLDLGSDDVRIRSVSIASPAATLAVSGQVSDFSEPVLDLDATADVTLDEAVAFAGLTEPVAGMVRAQTEIRGPVGALNVSGTAEAERLSVRRIDDLRVTTDFAYDLAARRVAFDDLQIAGPVGRVTAQGDVALDADAGTTRVEASVGALDIASVMRAASLDFVVNSRAGGQVSVAMPGLDHRSLEGSARLEIEPAGPVRQNALPIAGTVEVDARSSRIDARLAPVHLAGATATGTVVLTDRQRLGGNVEVDAPDLAQTIAAVETLLGRQPGTLVGTPISGEADVRAQLDGTLDDPAATLTLAVPSLTMGQAAGMQVEGGLVYTRRELTVDTLDVQWEIARAHVTGSVGLQGDRPIAIQAVAEQLSIPEILRALGRGDVPASGVVDAEATIGGTTAALTGEVAIRAADLAAYGEPLGALAATATLEPQSIVRAELRLEKPQPDGTGVLAASGTYDLDEKRFDADFNSGGLLLTGLTLPGDVPVRGRLDVAGRAQGTVEDPAATVRVAALDLIVEGRELGNVSVAADVANHLANLQIDSDRFATRATAAVTLAEGYPALFAVAVRDLDLATLPLQSDVALAGWVRATVEGSGDLARPESVTAAAAVESIDTSVNGHPIQIDGPATLRYADERIDITHLVLRARESLVALAGDLPLDSSADPGTIEIDAQLDLRSLAAYAPADLQLTAEGAATLMGRVEGSLRAIDPTLTLSIEQGAIAAAGFQPGLTGVQARIEVSNGELRVPDLQASLGPARLEATAHVPLAILPEDLPVAIPRAQGEASAKIGVAALDLSMLPGAPERLGGQVALTAEVRAARPELEALAGRIEFSTLRVAFDALSFEQQQPSRITIDQGVAAIEQLALAGSAGRIEARGEVGLGGGRPLDVTAEGQIDLASVTAIAGGAVQTRGPATFEIAASGTVDDPRFDGFVELSEATVASLDPAVALDELNLRIDLSPDRIDLTRLAGLLNGGDFTGSGHVVLDGTEPVDVAFMATISGMALDEPLDLRSLVDADIRITQQDDLFLVSGDVVIQEAGLTRDLGLDRGLLARIGRGRSLDLTVERNPLLERVRFDVAVTTATPVVLDNNLVRGEVTADVRVLGTPYETGLSGRLVIEEESTIALNERTYVVERGIITFIEERRIVPVFDLQLATEVGSYDILLTVTGPPGDTETVLTSPSNPELPEPDLIALLVTGRTLGDVRGEEVAQAQVLSYVTGLAGGSLGRELERATGLSRVRIEPNLISGETDPGARLTLGQDITDSLRLIYSTDLINGSEEIWIAEYEVTRRFQTRAVRQDDNSYRFEVSHDVRLGGTPRPKRDAARMRRTVRTIRIEGDPGLDPAVVLDRFGLEPDDTYDFLEARRGIERVEALYRRAGLLQSRIRVRRSEENDVVDLTLVVEAGPHVELVYEGVSPPRRVQDEVALAWQRGVFDGQRAGDAERALLEWLVSRRRVGAEIESAIEEVGPDRRRVVFTIDAGPEYRDVEMAFPGAAAVPAEDLGEIVREQDLVEALFTDPRRVTDLLERYYRELGYLSARVASPSFEFTDEQARAMLTVDEGPRFVVDRLDAAGNRVIPTEELLEVGLLRTGDPYLPAVAERTVALIRDRYNALGFIDATVRLRLDVDREAGTIDVTIEVDEGRQAIVADVTVDGTDRTSEALVRRQLAVAPTQPLSLAVLGESRRQLYETRAFELVDLLREEVPADSSGAPAEPPPDYQLVRLRVAVREVQPFRIRYGVFFDTERGPGGLVDFSNHNSLGSARVLALRARADAQLREGRIVFTQPPLVGLPLETTASLFYTQERYPETIQSEQTNVDRLGVSLQQEARLRNSYVLSYGYRFERQLTYDIEQSEPARVAPVTVALTRDTRDDVLDATRGQFLSQAFSISPSFLGADDAFLKYFGQFSTYQALRGVRRSRLTGEIVRPRLLYAGAIRLGLAQGIGRDGLVPPGERFLAGGSTTLRGFAQYAVGPVNDDGFPGGEASIVFNNEIRFPIVWRFDGVAFVDIGNVFAHVSQVSLDLRSAAGIGLRVRTPWFLGRVDFGVPLDRRPGESNQVFFSIGQAF